ncbi:MAG: hypothetical protein NT917_13305 [Microcystis aeruginosa WS75]|nr:hypothetical protein [Microcystis aeruginosa WS75]
MLNQAMNAKCVSYPKVSLGPGFKNITKECSELKSATPDFPRDSVVNFQDLALFDKALNFPIDKENN